MASAQEELVMLRQAHYDMNVMAAEMADHIAELYSQRAKRIRRDMDAMKSGAIIVALPDKE